MGDMDTFRLYAGLAVKLESDGHKAEQWQSLALLWLERHGLS